MLLSYLLLTFVRKVPNYHLFLIKQGFYCKFALVPLQIVATIQPSNQLQSKKNV